MREITPTERELEILKILWQERRATVRDVWRRLSRRDRELAYTTVLSLLQNMEKKGLAGHESAGKAYVYFATAGRGETIGDLAARFLERVFDGAMDEYLVHALQTRPPSPEELDRLEKMIAEARAEADKRAKKGRRS